MEHSFDDKTKAKMTSGPHSSGLKKALWGSHFKPIFHLKSEGFYFESYSEGEKKKKKAIQPYRRGLQEVSWMLAAEVKPHPLGER